MGSHDHLPDAPAPVSAVALTSLLMGSLGFCSAGLTGLVGFVLGIVAVFTNRRSPLALAGLTVSAVSLLVGPILAAMATYVAAGAFTSARQSAHNASAMMVLRELAAVSRTYAHERGAGLPPADDWMRVLDDYGGGVRALVSSTDRVYAMNRALGGRHVQDIGAPALTVLFFEAEPGSPPAGGPELLPTRPGFVQGYAIVFVDGHAANVRREKIARLIWQ